MFWAQSAIFVSLIFGIASEGNPWGLRIDRAELDAIKEALWEERGPSYEQDAPIVADPSIGQLTSYGGHCKTPCYNHRRRYYWCWADTVSGTAWDYCSPNNGDLTARGRKCKPTSKCDHSGGGWGGYGVKRYTWCATTTGIWDYCVPVNAK